MKLTNFQKVRDEFNISFDILNNDKPQLNLFETDPKLVKYRSSLINEENGEFNDAVDNKNFTEVIDALGDMLYVIYGAFSSYGVNADDAFDLIHKSNMSKLCKTEQEAIETVDFYIKDGRYDSPSYKLSSDGKHYIVYNVSTKKVLKSINYNPVNFDSLF